MRKANAILIALVITSLCFSQTKINWLNFNQAIEAQKKNPKKILIDVYTNWCSPCKLLNLYTFGNDKIAKYINENYYAVKFNAEGNQKIDYNGNLYLNPYYNSEKASTRNSMHQFAEFLNVDRYPTVIFMDEKSRLILPLVGMHGPEDMSFFLKLIASDKYKEFSNSDELYEYKTKLSSVLPN